MDIEDKPIPARLLGKPPAMVAFLMEIDAVCLKHGLVPSIKSNKWTPPSFEVRHYNRTDRNALLVAEIGFIGTIKPNQVEEVRASVVWKSCADNAENKLALYKDYCLRIERSTAHPNYNGFIDGRLIKVNGEFDDVAQMLFDVVDLRDPCDQLPPKG